MSETKVSESKINKNDTKIDDIKNAPLNVDDFSDLKIPKCWIDCPNTIDCHEISKESKENFVICKTPIDKIRSDYLKIPNNKRFYPDNMLSIVNKIKKIGLIVDLVDGKYYSWDNDNNTIPKVNLKISIIPTRDETNLFVNIVKNFFERNKGFSILIYSELGYNIAGFLISAYFINEMNWMVDAAVQQFSQYRKPGIFIKQYVAKLHEYYSDEDEIKEFEDFIKLRPLIKPIWYKLNFIINTSNNGNNNSNKDNGGFKMPAKKKIKRASTFKRATGLRKRKRKIEQTNIQTQNISTNQNISVNQNITINSNNNINSDVNRNDDIIEPNVGQSSMDNNNGQTTHSDIIEPDIIEPDIVEPDIMEPDIIEPSMNEPPKKKLKVDFNYSIPNELAIDHPYLKTVDGTEFGKITKAVLGLSKTQTLLQSIHNKILTIQKGALLSLAKTHRISWLSHGFRLWLLILDVGCYFIDPSYFKTGKLGGIYKIPNVLFKNKKTHKYVDKTLVNGELVIDRIKQNNIMTKIPRFLITDLLIFENSSYLNQNHQIRMKMVKKYLMDPCFDSLKNSNVRIRMKDIYDIKPGIYNKIKKVTNNLPHKCDGIGLFPINPPFGKSILRLDII